MSNVSYVAIEMLMHGLPLIGTGSTGLKEMVEGMHCLPLKEEDDSVDLPMIYWCSGNRRSRGIYGRRSIGGDLRNDILYGRCQRICFLSI